MFRMAVRHREPGVRFVARIPAMVALVLALAGCTSPRTIDGWSIGEVWKCTAPYCDSARRAAEAGLELRYPGHPTVASLTFHWEGAYRRPDGRTETDGHPAVGEIAVFQFADGTAVAFGVGHGVTGDAARAYFDPPFGDPPFGVPAE